MPSPSTSLVVSRLSLHDHGCFVLFSAWMRENMLSLSLWRWLISFHMVCFSSIYFPTNYIISFIFLAIQKFELRALSLLDRGSTT
jgi:hypothetical protein